jgi:MoaA/NifB/PqqE/SkfB family radical SAM enzyme
MVDINMNPFKEYIGRTFCIQPKVPETVQLEITNLCNLDCKMCPRKKLPVKYKEMHLSLFKKIVNKLVGVKEIILTGWGEPTTHKDLAEMVRFGKFKNKKVRLTTNGLLLNQKMRDDLVKAGIDSITFSVDSVDEENEWGHMNKKTLDNIRALSKMNKRPAIVIQSILEKPVSNLIAICDFAKSVGAERLNLSRVLQEFSPGMPRPSLKEEKEMVKKIFSHADKIGLQADMIQYGVGKGFVRTAYPLAKHTLGMFGKRCLRLFNYAYVNVEGDVTPCCLLPALKMDNLKDKNLKEIWDSKKFKDFRKNHNSHKLCRTCDLWRVNYIDRS